MSHDGLQKKKRNIPNNSTISAMKKSKQLKERNDISC